MFVSRPEYQFPVSPEFAPPDVKYWHSLELSANTAWFVLSVRPRYPDALLETLVLALDTDVVDAVASLDADVESLLCIAPHVRGKSQGWFCRQISEIWEGVAPENSGKRCVILVDEAGLERSGIIMDCEFGMERKRLVARVDLAPKRLTRTLKA